MRITLSALINFGSKGADKVAKKTKEIKDNLTAANREADRLSAIERQEARAAGATGGYHDKGLTKTGHRALRGVTEARGASGRNFSGLASGLNDGDTNNIVAAYATIAANIFAVTAAFSALQKAAQTEQLTRGIELMGARSGVALKATAQGLREVTDYAISTADAMKVVAQATAAGFKEEEILRIGAVARGASVALGRDMADAMDRLTRGTIKLEPELLDELGIMTRLDEAVRMYARAHNKTASSLTQTERRQAFLNAVLLEGEKKFGDISEQIDSNPYDRLSASIRDMGTSFLNLVNKALIPVTKLLTDMPGLAVGPLMAIFQESASKVLPDLGKGFDKLGDRINANIAKSKIIMGEFNEQLGFLEIAGKKALDTFDAADLGSLAGMNRQNMADLFNPKNRAVEDERDETREIIQARIVELQKRGNEEDKEKIAALTIINDKLKESEEYYTKLNKLGSKDSRTADNITLARRQQSRLQQLGEYQARGETLPGLKFALGAAAGDMSIWAKEGISFMEKVRTTSSAASFAVRALGSTFLRLLPVIGWAVTAFQLLQGAWEMMKSEAQKAVDESKKKLKELADQAKKTLVQIEKMREPGKMQLGQSIDAAVNSLQNLVAGFKELEEAQRKVKEGKLDKEYLPAATRTSNQGRRTVNLAPVETDRFLRARLGNDDAGKSYQEAVKVIRTLSNVEYTNLINKMRTSNMSLQESRDLVSQVADKVSAVNARYKTLSETIQQINLDTKEIIPKDLETDFTKIFKGMTAASKEMAGLTNISAIGQELSKFDTESLGAIRALTLLYTNDLPVLDGLDKIIKKITEIRELEYEIQKVRSDGGSIIGLQANLEEQTRSLGVLKGQYWDIILNAFGIVEARKQENIVNAAVIAQKIKINNLTLQEAKILSDINKKRKEALIESSKLGVVSFGAMAQDAARIDTAKEALRLAQEEARIRKESIDDQLKVDLQKAEEKAAIERQNNPNSFNEEFYQAEIQYLKDAARKEQELEDLKVRAAKSEYDTSVEISKIHSTDLAIRLRMVEARKEELRHAKELADMQSSTDRLVLQQAQDQTRFDRLISGGKITPDEERNFEAARLKLELKALEDRKKNYAEAARLERDNLRDSIQATIDSYTTALANADTEEARNLLMTEKNEKIREIQNKIAANQDLEEANNVEMAVREQGINALIDQLTKYTTLDYIMADFKRAKTELENNINMSIEGALMGSAARATFTKAVEDGGGVAKLGKEGVEQIKKTVLEMEELRIVSEGLNSIFDSMHDGLAGAFEGIITGTKSVKQAFGDMAMSILASIAKMISQMLAFRVMASLPGFGGFLGMPVPTPAGAAGGIIPMATGGIISKNRGLQGVVKQPTFLVGEGRYNEAVVPLPNGRSIPVQMHGGSSQSNNVQVNVNVSSNGNVQTETQGADYNNLGTMIANAVQKELLAQKMPGGILNRYGAS